MPSQLTADVALVGDIAIFNNQIVHIAKNTIARTDTVAKALFTLPAGAVIIGLRVYIPVASNAATTAVISVGKLGGTGTEFLNVYDVKGNTGQIAPAIGVLGTVGTSNITVTGIYAETGGASTLGGPFLVICEYTPA